jgi:peptidoglycan hydrolase CwlO-like protein
MLGRHRTLSAIVLIAVMSTSIAYAQNGTNLPNGRPFQQIETQLTEVQQQMEAMQQQMQAMQEQLQALQTRVDAIESNLQTEMAGIYSRLDGLQNQIVTVADGVAALQDHMADTDEAIAALNAAVADLRSQLEAVQAQIADNTGDIASLRKQAGSLQTLIALHQSQIAGLTNQNSQINEFLTNMVNATCQGGQAISNIGAGGIIACTQAGGTLSSYTTFMGGSMSANGVIPMNVSCQPGYIVTGGGYYRASFYETVQYVSSVSTTPVYHWIWSQPTSSWSHLYTGQLVTPTYGYMQRDPISVLSNRTGSGSYTVEFLYTPQSGNLKPYFEVWATCARVN